MSERIKLTLEWKDEYKEHEDQMPALYERMDSIALLIGKRFRALDVENLSAGLEEVSAELRWIGGVVADADRILNFFGGEASETLINHPKYEEIKSDEKRKLMAAVLAKYTHLHIRAEKTEEALKNRLTSLQSTLKAYLAVYTKTEPHHH